MALADNKDRKVKMTRHSSFRSFPVASNQTIYEGAIVCINKNGNAIKGINGNEVVGIAAEKAVNSTTTIDNDNIVIVESGQLEKLPYSGACASHIGMDIYSVSDNSVSTAGSTLSVLGKVYLVETDAFWAKVND